MCRPETRVGRKVEVVRGDNGLVRLLHGNPDRSRLGEMGRTHKGERQQSQMYDTHHIVPMLFGPSIALGEGRRPMDIRSGRGSGALFDQQEGPFYQSLRRTMNDKYGSTSDYQRKTRRRRHKGWPPSESFRWLIEDSIGAHQAARPPNAAIAPVAVKSGHSANGPLPVYCLAWLLCTHLRSPG